MPRHIGSQQREKRLAAEAQDAAFERLRLATDEHDHDAAAEALGALRQAVRMKSAASQKLASPKKESYPCAFHLGRGKGKHRSFTDGKQYIVEVTKLIVRERDSPDHEERFDREPCYLIWCEDAEQEFQIVRHLKEK